MAKKNKEVKKKSDKTAPSKTLKEEKEGRFIKKHERHSFESTNPVRQKEWLP